MPVLSVDETVGRVADWLREHFPPQTASGRILPVDVRWVPKVAWDYDDPDATPRQRRLGCYGDCNKIGRRFLIRLSRLRCRLRAQAVETLHHEWAHTITWDRGNGHERAMWVAYGRIYRRLHEGDGARELGIALS